MVVEGEIVAWDDVDACIFLDLPVCQSKPLALFKEFFLGELATPVGFGGFFEISVDSHTRETEN